MATKSPRSMSRSSGLHRDDGAEALGDAAQPHQRLGARPGAAALRAARSSGELPVGQPLHAGIDGENAAGQRLLGKLRLAQARSARW